jgi:hypothetical protein
LDAKNNSLSRLSADETDSSSFSTQYSRTPSRENLSRKIKGFAIAVLRWLYAESTSAEWRFIKKKATMQLARERASIGEPL